MLPSKTIHTDVLIIGAGLTGIRAANAAARHGVSVLVVSKSPANASRDIMGFNAAVTPQDSEELYFNDMLRSGCGINHRGLVRALVSEATRQIEFIEELGFRFDKNEDGTYHAQSPLGCSVPRLVHQEARTGTRVMDLLEADCRRRGVKFSSRVYISDLLSDNGVVYGAAGIDLSDMTFACFVAKTVVLATGGGGSIRRISTYPEGLNGDGYAIAHRAGVELIDMEFQQYEPCCTVYPKNILGCILTTTMMKRGATLTNNRGESVIERNGLTLDDLQKDTLARAMLKEIEDGNGTEHGGLWFDATMLPRWLVVVEHNIFYDPVLAGGIDIMKEKAEVAPAAHTTLGGVRINPDCSCNVKGLYAAGEITGGVHGANRLGGSAGAETISMGFIAGDNAAQYALQIGSTSRRAETLGAAKHRESSSRLSRSGPGADGIRESLGRLLDENAGLKRNACTLNHARSALAYLAEKAAQSCACGEVEKLVALLQLENMLLLAAMQIESSLLRTESRGVFFRTDFPSRDDANWEKNIVIRNQDGAMDFAVEECGQEI